MTYILANPHGKTAKERRGGWIGSGWIRRTTRLAIYLRDKFRCLYCDRDLTECAPVDVTLDHLQPACLGGKHVPSNLVTCCRACNKSKRAKLWRDFADADAFGRIRRAKRRRMDKFIKLAKELRKEQNNGKEVRASDKSKTAPRRG